MADDAVRPTDEGAGLDPIRLYNCGCRVQGAAFTPCGRHDEPPTPLTEAVAREALGLPLNECPGCYADTNGLRPGQMLAHAVFCSPPGFLDLLLWHQSGTITPTLARQVGASIGRMAGAPSSVGRAR